MIKEIKKIFPLMASLQSVFGAIAIMFSDIYKLDLQILMIIAAILSIVLSCIPFLHGSGTRKE